MQYRNHPYTWCIWLLIKPLLYRKDTKYLNTQQCRLMNYSRHVSFLVWDLELMGLGRQNRHTNNRINDNWRVLTTKLTDSRTSTFVVGTISESLIYKYWYDCWHSLFYNHESRNCSNLKTFSVAPNVMVPQSFIMKTPLCIL